MSAAAKTPEDVLLFAVIDCAHHITDAQIILKYEPGKTGRDALDQLGHRLESALQAAIGLVPSAVASATVVQALTLAHAKAAKMREAAAHDGHHNDGGAGHLIALCNAFDAGWQHAVPEFLSEFMTQAEREADPEYAQYQRLHAKFGGKA